MPEIRMQCPLCGKGLTDADQSVSDDRFRCPDCYALSAEAKRGWLLSQRTQIQASRARVAAHGMSQAMEGSPWFAMDANGKTVTRKTVCECGAHFMQRLLSERFRQIVDRQGAGAMRAMERDIKSGYVPVHCPPCERRDLGMSARRAEYAEAAD